MTGSKEPKGARRRKPRPRPRRARVGSKAQPEVQEAVEFVYECLASRMRRAQIIEAVRREVARRQAEHAEDPVAMPEHRLLRATSESSIDDYIRAARDRMAADTSPDRARQVKAEITALYRQVQRRLITKDPEAAAKVAQMEAKLHGLIVERHALTNGSLEGYSDDELSRLIENARQATAAV